MFPADWQSGQRTDRHAWQRNLPSLQANPFQDAFPNTRTPYNTALVNRTGRNLRHPVSVGICFVRYRTHGLLPVYKHLPHDCASSKSTSGRCIFSLTSSVQNKYQARNLRLPFTRSLHHLPPHVSLYHHHTVPADTIRKILMEMRFVSIFRT